MWLLSSVGKLNEQFYPKEVAQMARYVVVVVMLSILLSLVAVPAYAADPEYKFPAKGKP